MNQSSATARDEYWERIKAASLRSAELRPPTTARGVHHIALICTDVERTIDFYQGILGFSLTELFENRDYDGSTHFFFDIGNGNLLAFFDFPGLDLSDYTEVLGGMHHIAISMDPGQHAQARAALDAHGIDIEYEYETSIYFHGPDGERLELIADPLGQMYGEAVN